MANDSVQQQSRSGAQNEQSAQRGQDQDTIRQAQQALNEKGQQVQADGKLGPKTQAAVRDFQQQQGISPSGQLDQETLAALGVDQGSSGTGSTSSPSSEPSGSPSSDTPASQSD